uniref:Uncharacterized protein n=1 Tax=Rhizophora mucronata TaxID=61149 RepID=A0A2P2JAJ4_RHIMU
MSDEDEWVKLAMTDDSVIVRLLLKLSEAPPVAQQPQQPVVDSGAATLRVQWSVRQRRSRCVPRKKGDTTRASPTTPLSWSGATATSFSGGATAAAADGFEESSLAAKPVDTARSKVTVASETSTVKRSRKKKVCARSCYTFVLCLFNSEFCFMCVCTVLLATYIFYGGASHRPVYKGKKKKKG